MARRLAIELLMVAGLALILGLIGPFGTFALPAGARIAYWMVFGIIGYAIFRPLIIVGSWFSESLKVPRVAGVGLALLVAAVPMTLLVAMLLWGFDPAKALTNDGLPLLYAQVWLIGFLINGFFMLIYRTASEASSEQPCMVEPVSMPCEEAPTAPAEAMATRGPALADRLPPGFGPVVALKGEDHYVRVIGASRSELVLIRLRDAIAAMGAIEGAQVHRSWWVAREGVASLNRSGREAEILLPDGTRVPVSREGLSLIRSLGWT